MTDKAAAIRRIEKMVERFYPKEHALLYPQSTVYLDDLTDLDLGILINRRFKYKYAEVYYRTDGIHLLPFKEGSGECTTSVEAEHLAKELGLIL